MKRFKNAIGRQLHELAEHGNRTNLKRHIEDSAQSAKRIYREQLISLYI